MEKLKNVGAGPVSAQKEVIGDCPKFSKWSKQRNIGCNSVHSNFNGITLIALIITVIVMLILVGVTITVALNGGLFETANKAATGTQKESERERLTEIALANYNVSEGKITSADDLASKIESSLGLKKDTDKTTETKLVIKGKDTLWQIDLTTAEVKEYEEEKLKTYKGSYITLTFKDDKNLDLLGEAMQYQLGNKVTLLNSNKYPNGTYTMIKIDSTNSGQYMPQVLMHENGEFAIWSTAAFNENITEEELENNTNVDLLYLQK